MNWVAILLEWIGTFFLAIEAIKLSNLAILREKVMAAALSGGDKIFLSRREGPVRVLISVSFMVTGSLTLWGILHLLHIDAPALLQRWIDYLKYLEVPLSLFVGYLSFIFALLIAGIIGVMLCIVPFVLLMLLSISLFVLEENTASGIMGIIGFTLFSIASFLKLFGAH
jgi:hypothetical protein